MFYQSINAKTRSSCFVSKHEDLVGDPGGIRTHGLSLRRRPLYPAELRDHTLESPYFARLSRLRRLLTVRLGVIFANLEGRFLISFSNFGGRTFSHLLILTFGSGASE